MELISKQLSMLGLGATLESANGATPAVRTRRQRAVTRVHDLMSDLPESEEIGFLHSGLCQTFLPHARPDSNFQHWTREAGRFTLVVAPGYLPDRLPPGRQGRQPTAEESQAAYVGVPYGTKARLIMIHLQTEGVKGRTVSLGPTLTSFMRSLGLSITGGQRGSINAVKEQCMRIARCTFTMQWRDTDPSGDARMIIRDTKIAEGLEIWDRSSDRSDWTGEVTLSEGFHEHLREHAVPLDKRALALLAGNSLGLDLYALFAYRAPRLTNNLFLRWESLQGQIGADTTPKELARKVRQALPMVQDAYPGVKLEVTRHGIVLRPSAPAVPKTMVNGYAIASNNA